MQWSRQEVMAAWTSGVVGNRFRMCVKGETSRIDAGLSKGVGNKE